MTIWKKLRFDLAFWKIELGFYPPLVWITSALLFAASALVKPFAPTASLALLSMSHQGLTRLWGRGWTVRWLNGCVERGLRRACSAPGLVERAAAKCIRGSNGPQINENSGLVLKAPHSESGRVVEKGALLLKYSMYFNVFQRSVNMAELLRQYVLILEPSWSGYASPAVLNFAAYRGHTIVVLAPFQGDYELLERLGSNLHPFNLGPGDWVNPQIFRPLDGVAKQFDAVMIARWSLIKRHWVLLNALRGDSSLRAALVATTIAGDTAKDFILDKIERLGLSSQITIFEDVEPGELNVILNQSKVNLLLSRQEGGNRGLFEGFFAGVPGLALRNHIGIPVGHFQPETGRLINECALPDALQFFREHWNDFNPRAWALANIAPEPSTRKLNAALRQLADKRGEPWTRDIVARCNRPHPRYYPDEHAGSGLATIEELLVQFAREDAS